MEVKFPFFSSFFCFYNIKKLTGSSSSSSSSMPESEKSFQSIRQLNIALKHKEWKHMKLGMMSIKKWNLINIKIYQSEFFLVWLIIIHLFYTLYFPT